MRFKLGNNILKGQKIKTANGWRTVKEVVDEGVMVKEGLIKFGSEVFGWKAN